MIRKLREILRHFLRRLRETPLLLGWLLVGPLVALFMEGWRGLALGLFNLVILGCYGVLIRWMTPDPPRLVTVRRPGLELGIALVLLALTFTIQLLDFGVWKIQPIQGWVREFFISVELWVKNMEIIPNWAGQAVFMTVSSTLKQLIPTLLVFWLLGFGPREMGLARPHWKLSGALLGTTVIFGLATGFLFHAPFVQILGLYFIGLFINALPEELFFRGMLLPRLEKLTGNPLNSLVISAILFNAIHIPIQIAHGVSPFMALLGVFSTDYPTGLIWGYLYLRTRSILPGILWHAANGNLGFLMMDL